MKLGTITDALTVTQEAVDRVGQEVTKLVPVSRFDLTLLSGRAGPMIGHGRPSITGIPLLESASSTNKVS